MKTTFKIIFLLLLMFLAEGGLKKVACREYTTAINVKQERNDSLQPFRIINNTSLKSLPGIVKDLSQVLNEFGFQEKFFVDKEGITIYLHNATYKTFHVSASVESTFSSTNYHVKINKFNQFAKDKALAATLIHETMHCVLMSIYMRAIHSDKKALESIIGFGLNKNDSSLFFSNDFFFLMNEGEDGSHELMYRLFYPKMVTLLKRFAEIHKQALDRGEAEFLMWSGLQKTNAYLALSDEKRSDIEYTILTAKGFSPQRN